MNIKQFIKNTFQSFFYFYSYLGYRMFVVFILSLLLGLIDGIGLAMFVPLLQMLGKDYDGGAENLGKLDFIPELFESFGVEFGVINVLILILIFFFLKGILKFLEGYSSVIYQQFFIRKIRVSNINLLNSFKFSAFVKSDAGRIQNTFSGEVEKVIQAYRGYNASLQYAGMIFMYLILAFSSNISFAMMVFVGGAATNFIFKFLYKKTKDLSKKVTVQNHSFQGLLIQQVAFFKYLKATGLNFKYGRTLISNITEIEHSQRKMGVIASLLNGLREPLTIFVVVIAIIIQVTYLNAEMGTMIISLLLIYRALSFFMAMQDHWNKFLAVSGSLENMTNFTEELKAGIEKIGDVEFLKFSDKINLDNVSFNYNKSLVLDSINLNVYKNESLAIIGESGSGKSTLMNLLAGLIIPSKGEIFIDGKNVKSLNLNSYRRKIGYIGQDAAIFSDTVFNNITFWDIKSSENYTKFIDACKKASIHEFIEGLPNKEDEILGSNGINISGGQKQRLSIARELYKEVDLLLMDEATSALDGETEAAIQFNIDKLKGHYTIIMIAHRLATIKNADRIILLKDGRIEAIGSYNELIENSSKFRNMIKLQEL